MAKLTAFTQRQYLTDYESRVENMGTYQALEYLREEYKAAQQYRKNGWTGTSERMYTKTEWEKDSTNYETALKKLVHEYEQKYWQMCGMSK